MKYLIWVAAMLFLACGTLTHVPPAQVAQAGPVSDEQFIDSLLATEISTDQFFESRIIETGEETGDTEEVEFIIEKA